MKKALTYLVKMIVDAPDEVKIEEQKEENARHFTVWVAKDDRGKIIGKGGKIIRALRNAMKIPATKSGTYVSVNLAENSPS